MKDQKPEKLKLGQFHRFQKNPNKRYQSVKKRIRDIERLLAKPNLPEGMITAKKKELQELKKQGKEKKHIKVLETKYKQVKFFELKKAQRKLKKAENELKQVQQSLDEGKEEKEKELESKIQAINEDIQYIKYFPDNTKYIALYATDSPTEETLN